MPKSNLLLWCANLQPINMLDLGIPVRKSFMKLVVQKIKKIFYILYVLISNSSGISMLRYGFKTLQVKSYILKNILYNTTFDEKICFRELVFARPIIINICKWSLLYFFLIVWFNRMYSIVQQFPHFYNSLFFLFW